MCTKPDISPFCMNTACHMSMRGLIDKRHYVTLMKVYMEGCITTYHIEKFRTDMTELSIKLSKVLLHFIFILM